MKHLEKYYEGKGCKCFARSSSECGCHDVDWTPKAVYELRAERDSLQIALEEISNLAKTLKNERDEARTELEMWHDGNIIHLFHRDELEKTERERDEARDELRDIRLNLGEDADGCTLLHAVCVLQNERDEARVALMKIEDLFIDGTDIYADRETMGEIAREALGGAK
jgi:hypothetical protein